MSAPRRLPCPADASAIGAMRSRPGRGRQTAWELKAMAKGQKKSNKEVRKPKADKPKAAPPGRTFLTPPSAKK